MRSTIDLNGVPVFARPESVSHRMVERTGIPMPVDAVLELNNDGCLGVANAPTSSLVETVGEQVARVGGWHKAADPMGNIWGSAPGLNGGW